MKKLQAFSWGYWGWGTHTKEFVRTVDAIERQRGYRPPIFVDIRFSRSVRATGFRQQAFEATTGKNRYVWMKSLGNAKIGSGENGIRISKPTAARDLLKIVVDSGREKQRVIFFCSCEDPKHCHRARVASLLVKAATQGNVPLNVVEWPGEEPKTAKLNVSDKILKEVLAGGNRVSLAEQSQTTLKQMAGLPWCSRVELRSDITIAIISGPAKLASQWYMPVIGPKYSDETDTVETLKNAADRLRKTCKYEPLSSN
jgi:hypothetical protein